MLLQYLVVPVTTTSTLLVRLGRSAPPRRVGLICPSGAHIDDLRVCCEMYSLARTTTPINRSLIGTFYPGLVTTQLPSVHAVRSPTLDTSFFPKTACETLRTSRHQQSTQIPCSTWQSSYGGIEHKLNNIPGLSQILNKRRRQWTVSQ